MNGKYTCSYCPTKNGQHQEISCGSSSSANLRKHLHRKHSDYQQEWEPLFTEFAESRSRNSKPVEEEGEAASISSSRMVQPSLHVSSVEGKNTAFLRSLANQPEIDTLVLDVITENMIPFSVADSCSMERLLDRVRKVFSPSRRKVMDVLTTEAARATAEMQAQLDKQEHVTITADLWTARRRSYMGFTVHYLQLVSEEDQGGGLSSTLSSLGVKGDGVEVLGVIERVSGAMVRRSWLLGCRRMKGRHTYDVVAREILGVMNEFNLAGKVRGIVTDNASNFVKAFG